MVFSGVRVSGSPSNRYFRHTEAVESVFRERFRHLAQIIDIICIDRTACILALANQDGRLVCHERRLDLLWTRSGQPVPARPVLRLSISSTERNSVRVIRFGAAFGGATNALSKRRRTP